MIKLNLSLLMFSYSRLGCLFLMLCWPALLACQQSFFLDSLFSYDFSTIKEKTVAWQKAEIERLNKDFGLSANVTITNTFQDEIGDDGLSTRLMAKANFWKGGMKDNRLQSDILYKQMLIDSIKGDQEHLNHNYGIYYDYIIYLSNIQKKEIIDTILMKCGTHIDYLNELYYNKLIDYQQILNVKRTRSEFMLLKQSQQSYNDVFRKILGNTNLPDNMENKMYEVDFESLTDDIAADTTVNELIRMEYDIIDDRYSRQTLSGLSVSAGYDISKGKPRFTINYSRKFRSVSKKEVELNKDLTHERYKLVHFQKIKELINYQYEYDYKLKQYQNLHYKMNILQETLRQLRVKREILSLNESIEERKLLLDSLLIQYEMMDLRQQNMLILLAIKKRTFKKEIKTYLREIPPLGKEKKYFANRYILLEDDKLLNNEDKTLLEQNEIRIINALAIVDLKNIVLIDPDKYTDRKEMESAIMDHMSTDSDANFLITNIEDLKALELRTIRDRSFSHVNR